MSMPNVMVEPQSLNERVVQEINALKGRYRLQQADLAEALHLPQSQVSRRLSGKVPFSLAEIELAAEFFGISPAVLLGMVDPGAADESPRPRAARPLARPAKAAGERWAHWESNPEPAGYASNVVTGLFLQPGEWADTPDRDRPAEVVDLAAHRRPQPSSTVRTVTR